MAYNVTNWYWYVGADRTQVFSSASGTFVPVSDPVFVAWQAADPQNVPPIMASAADLGAVLAPNLVRPADSSVLDGYQTAQATSIVAQVIFKILFQHENRIRTIERQLGLNGSPPNLTAQQAVAAVKSLM